MNDTWLVARPIAHRGLHDVARGRVENSRAAAAAAIAAGCAIECDVQISADGEAMVFHDERLDRLTGAHGLVASRRAADLTRLELTGGGETIPTLADWLGGIAGAVPVICEIKSAFDGDMRLAERTAALARAYAGPIALKSFDPAILRHLRETSPDLRRGLVAEARYHAEDWPQLLAPQRAALESLAGWSEARPDFLSWRVDDLPHATPNLCRAFGLPVMCWTVRDERRRALALRHADQIVFERIAPFA